MVAQREGFVCRNVHPREVTDASKQKLADSDVKKSSSASVKVPKGGKSRPDNRAKRSRRNITKTQDQAICTDQASAPRASCQHQG